MRRLKVLIIFSVVTLSFSVQAARNKIVWTGYGSLYGTKGVSSEVQNDYTTHSNFSNLNRIGLNVVSDFAKNFKAVGQTLLAGINKPERDKSPDWKMRVDKGYLEYHKKSYINLRLGRQFVPASINYQNRNVGLDTTFVRVPDHIDLLVPAKSYNGVSFELVGRRDSSTFLFSFFGGNEEYDQILPVSNEVSGEMKVTYRSIVGAAFSYKGKRNGLTFHTHMSRAKVDAVLDRGEYLTQGIDQGTLVILVGSDVTDSLALDTLINYTFGIGFNKYNIHAKVEYSILDGTGGTDMAGISSGLYMDNFYDKARGGYAMLGYQISKLLPYYMYSTSKWNTGFINDEHTAQTLGLNYKFSKKIASKGEFSEGESKKGSAFASLKDKKVRSVSIGVDFIF